MISIVEQVFKKLNIDYTPRKNGVELQFRCINPNHPDRHASASINTQTGQWKCFSCLMAGNLKSLVKIVSGDTSDIDNLITPKDTVKFKIGSIYKASTKNILSYENTVNFSHTIECLMNDFMPATRDITSLNYLVKKRKLTKDTIKRHRLKYCKTGQYADRIIIPYYMNDELIGFNSRYIGDNPTTLRYLYCLNNSLFESFIYNYENITNNEYCILAEGPFDLMYLVQCGYKNVISTLNTNISRKQLTKILNFKKIIFCFDNDEKTKAGQNAVLKHARDILDFAPDLPIYSAELPVGKDPNECTPDEILYAFSHLKRIRLEPKAAPLSIFEYMRLNYNQGML